MRKTSLVLAALLAVVGVCVMLWPVFTGHRLQADTDAAVQEFLAERNEPEQQYPELLAELQAYNQRIYTEKQSGLVDLEACEEPAVDLTAYGIDDEIIGVLEIPAMDLTMPIYLPSAWRRNVSRRWSLPSRRKTALSSAAWTTPCDSSMRRKCRNPSGNMWTACWLRRPVPADRCGRRRRQTSRQQLYSRRSNHGICQRKRTI